MYIRIGIFRCVELENPVHRREVESTCGNISGEKNRVRTGQEALIDGKAFGLLLFSVEMEKRDTGLQLAECFKDKANLQSSSGLNNRRIVMTYLFSTRHEHNRFHLEMCLYK